MTIPPKVSVLTTVFNREQFVAEAIESVLNCGYDDFEYVIVDDCSQDASWDIILAYARRDERIKPYRNSKNIGDYANRNEAASKARGEYLKYVDSDDVLKPKRLEKFVKQMDKHPEAAYAIDNQIDAFLTPKQILLHALFRGERAIGGAPSALLIRRTAFHLIGGFNPRPGTGDFELQTKLAAQFPILLVKSDFVQVRTVDTNQSALHLQSIPTRKAIHRLTLDFGKSAGDFSLVERKKIIQQVETILAREIAKELLRFSARDFIALRANFCQITGHDIWTSLLKRKRTTLHSV